VRYSIRANDITSIYETHKSQQNLLDNVLKPGLRDVVRAQTAKFPPFQVKERRAELSQNIREALEESWGKMGVVVDDVDLGDLSLDEDTEKSISRVNAAQAAVEEQRAMLEQAYIAAETTKTDAKAQADADQIVRCGATTATETQIVAGKEQEVTVVVPLSGAECENRLNEQVLTSKWFDTLTALGADGNMTILIPEDGTTPIVQLPQAQPQD
jgi:regulator of protease activity HflC (stomatin/prohibitin superfamily)